MADVRADVLAAFEAGQVRWPGVEMPLADFALRMETLGVAGDGLARHGPDLFLAAACAAGDDAAIRHFDAVFVSGAGNRVARFELSADEIDDLRQKLRMKLLVGPTPGIGGYRGHAPLGAWLQVAAVRVAVDLASQTTATFREDVNLLMLVAPDETPEMETVRRLYEERFREVLEASFAALSPREKTILRLHVVDGLNIDAIGAIYAVHRATAARWLVGIRARVQDRLKKEFAMRWNASSSELRSLVSLLRDQIHITAERILDAG